MYGENPFLTLDDKPFFLPCQVLIFPFFQNSNSFKQNFLTWIRLYVIF